MRTESPRRNPDWWTESIFLVFIKLKIELNISFPENFPQIGNKYTDRYLFLITHPLFYVLQQYFILFQRSGRHPDARQFSKSKISGLHIERAHSLSIFAEISSCPWALFGSRFLISWEIASEEMLKELTLSSVKWFKVEGMTLLLLIVVHWLAKIY